MIGLAIEAAASAHLMFLAVAMNTHNLKSALIFRFPAAILGSLLGFRAFGAFMGWPV